ncbi:MAG: cobalt ECF transporter T component CbiQ [Candidatus Edwardsbacteria bacterium]|nr:cobalt ECF transporter T component CbiQ [Candidatus Edwardsbacteria bacterium]MBU1576034.1 cobalt ECF transporter T component CbiQ [Candidatus Edwardsbacteria bacterium]MBU2463057.1 cobalt ECF transporter T component CbiQ [Candidatus Edwardsbacteria bacterium]MBU2594307.1 cobalt ECF transporter T component CbiQ [Candidatus Edwardsbacteria bacterium]
MPNIVNAIYNIRQFEELARRDSFIHRMHPLTKLLATLVYTVLLVSYDKYAIIALLPFVFFPVFVATAGRIPAGPLLKRLLYVEPMIIGIGLLNPLFDHGTVTVLGHTVSSGWLIFLSIFLKGTLAVVAALLLIATTGMDGVALSLRKLKVPKIFVLQMMLTYRYIYVLLEEAARTTQAYALRAFNKKGLKREVWGPLLGQILLRTIDRAQRVYDAMCLRGFAGEYHVGKAPRPGLGDFLYVMGWGTFFAASRAVNLPLWLGNLLAGAVK